MYNEKLLETFINAENSGDLKHASATATVKSKKFGDVIKISIKVSDNLKVEQATYKAFGGVITSVCASVICDIVQGKSLIAAQKINSEHILQKVADIPEEKKYCASLAVIALLEAIKKYLRKQKKLENAKNKTVTTGAKIDKINVSATNLSNEKK